MNRRARANPHTIATAEAARTQPFPPSAVRLSGQDGAALYDRLCSPCHAKNGSGRGPAAPWLSPRPRNFSKGEYKWRSTATGSPPTDNDLALVIRHGVPGTSMNSFGEVLHEDQIMDLVRTVKSFAPRHFSRDKEVLAPFDGVTSPDIARGKKLYQDLGCAKCHGPKGRGDGPSAEGLKDSAGRKIALYDLTRAPLRRPGPEHPRAIASIYQTLITGLSGTPMPSYHGAAPAPDLWSVAAYVDSIRFRGPRPTNGGIRVTAATVAADRKDTLVEVARNAGGDAQEAKVWGEAIARQGPPPPELAPAQASLSARRCARCHAKQEREWTRSFHASASSPGVLAQLLPREAHAAAGDFVEGCQRCHAPLAEQNPLLPAGGTQFAKNHAYSPSLRAEGINCASCHVRKWERLGPKKGPNHSLLSLVSYPLQELAIYERSDFCMGCHQLPPRTAVAGKPRLNTYREWLESPYMRRGIQCQHCHMPNREHTWKGVHDPATFRQGIEVSATSRLVSNTLSITASVKNAGAGHFLPTTPTPAAWLRVSLLDEDGDLIANSKSEKRIGWHLEFGRGWREIEDTRIPPGQSLRLSRTWSGSTAKEAAFAKVEVRVHPDDFYEGFYRSRLAGSKLTKRDRALFESALERALKARYTAFEQRYPIAQ